MFRSAMILLVGLAIVYAGPAFTPRESNCTLPYEEYQCEPPCRTTCISFYFDLPCPINCACYCEMGYARNGTNPYGNDPCILIKDCPEFLVKNKIT